MFKNIIIPEKIGSYYIFPKRILGFELTKVQISAIQINVFNKFNVNIEKYLEQSLESGTDYLEKNVNSLKKLIKNFDKSNSIRVAIPSHLIIFKELSFPFIDIYKIKSVLHTELEPILPFPIEEAIFDFIILNENQKTKQTKILAAVARKKDVDDLTLPFKNIGLTPDAIIVDILGLYGIYKSLPQNFNTQNTEILLNIEFSNTSIAYIQFGQLKLIRSIHFGILDIARKISDQAKINSNEALEYLIRFGLENKENSDYKQAIDNAISELITRINLTLNSFHDVITNFTKITKIILIGSGADIKQISTVINNQLNINCEILGPNSLLQNKNFKIKEKNLPNSAMISLGVAYPSTTTENFNLIEENFNSSNISLIKKQIITFSLLFFAVLFTLLWHSNTQFTKLTNEINFSRNEVMTVLKNTFGITDPSSLKNLQLMIQAATDKVNEEEIIWFSFSQTARFSFVKYLQELSSIIDREKIGLQLKKLILTPELITLEGEVRDFKSLEALENALSESKLFSHISVPQDTKFTIKITIKKNEEL